MPVTSKDIANRLGLSQPTVSRILNGTPGYRVSPATRQRVLDMARQLEYRPNAVARSLRHRKTNIVGFYTGYGVLEARNGFLAEVIGGLQRAADNRRLDLLLHGVFRGRSTDDIYGELADGRIDGLILHTSADDPLVAKLATSSLPVVAIADPLPGLPSVGCDDGGGVRQLFDLLWSRGHRKFAYVVPTIKLASVERRCSAFKEAAAAHGVSDADSTTLRVGLEESGQILDWWEASPDRPSAICCWNDLAAFDLLHGSSDHNIRVPEDLAVVGFDGYYDRRLTSRRLTTAVASWQEVTRVAIKMLVARINGEEVPMESVVPVTISEGDTA